MTSSPGKGTLRQFVKSQWPATQVIMTLVWYNPNPTCLAPLIHGEILLFDRPNTQPIRFHTVMTTLHTSSIPPWGMLQFSTRRMGTNPILLSSITNCLYPSQHVWTALSILLRNTSFKKSEKIIPALTPKHQSSDAKPQHTMTVYKPYNNSLVGNKTRHN